MAGEPALRAGWALWSKPPGSRDDYSVVACSSGPFTRAEFSTIITRFAAGTPDTRAAGPGALPWVTVSWVGVDEGLHLGIAITDQTGQVDGVGRPITQTSYYCVPYADLAAIPVSYSSLFDKVRSAGLPWRDGGAIPLLMPRATPEDAAKLIDKFGERVTAAASALLLRGPVSVVQAEGSKLDERLEFIDAVASLLPYGFRARFSAATWSDSATRNRIRLAFAARPREDATAVVWRQAAEVPAGDNIAFRYFEQFGGLRGGGARTDRVFTVPAVISHLAMDTAPRKFEQPQQALASLRRIDLPFRVEKAVLNGEQVDLAELRQVFGSGRLTELGPDGRAALVRALSERGGAEDWPTLSQSLDHVPDVETVRLVLAEFGRRLLWNTAPEDGVLRDSLRVAASHGVQDRVLAAMILPPDVLPGRAGVFRPAAELAASAVLADGASYEETRAVLAGTTSVAAEFMAALADSPDSAARLLRWLAPATSPVLVQPFAVALGIGTGKLTEADVTHLGATSVDSVRALLETASRAGHLEDVLPGCARWLAARGETGPDERRYWSEHLKALIAVTPRSRAWLDMALLTVGTGPSDLPPPAGDPGSEAYIADLVGIWEGLSRDYALFNGERCARTLAAYLAGTSWTGSKAQAAAVTELAGKLVRYDREHLLVSSVAGALAAVPAAKRWDFARDWLAWIRKNDPEAVRQGVLASLASAAPGSHPSQLAGLCLRALQQDISPESALYQLGKSGAIDSVEVAARTLVHLRQEFDRAGVKHETTDIWLQWFASELARGRFGQSVGDGIRGPQTRAALDEMKLQLRMLMIFAGAGRSEGPYELGEEVRDELATIGGRIESLIRSARKRPSLWRKAGDE